MPKAGPSRVRPSLLAWLSSLRVATTDQCSALVSPHAVDSEYVRRALTQLRTDGLAESAAVGWSHQYVWFLTRAGEAAAAMARGRDVPRREPVRPAMVRSGVLTHALEVTATVITLTGEEMGPECWRLEPRHRFKIGAIDQTLRADAELRAPGLDDADAPQALIIELDRATMPVFRLASELAAYRDYARARLAAPRRTAAAGSASVPVYARDFPGARRLPPVLVVLSNGSPETLARRRRRLCEQAGPAAEESIDAGVTTLAELQEHGPTGAIVTPLYAPDRLVRLDRLARSRAQPLLAGAGGARAA